MIRYLIYIFVIPMKKSADTFFSTFNYKKIALYVGVFIAFFAIVLGLAWYFTRGVVIAADHIFETLAHKQVQEVYESSAAIMQKEVPQEDFEKFIAQFQLDSVISTSWNNRSIKNQLGEVQGVVTLEDGRSLQVKISFIKEEGEWKMYYIGFPKHSLEENGFTY